MAGAHRMKKPHMGIEAAAPEEGIDIIKQQGVAIGEHGVDRVSWRLSGSAAEAVIGSKGRGECREIQSGGAALMAAQSIQGVGSPQFAADLH